MVDNAGRWVETFQSAFPKASWIAVGLIRLPDDQDAWVAQGLTVELDDVLTTRLLPRQTLLPDGYTVRRLLGGDGSNRWRGRWPRTTERVMKT